MNITFKRFLIFTFIVFPIIFYFSYFEKSEEKKEPLDFYFHLVADVEFDGEKILFDDYILCEAYTYKYLGRVADRGYRMGSITQGKRLKGGGVLFLKTPHFCGEGNRAWNLNRRKKPEDRLSDQAALQGIEPRMNYLPLFSWTNHDTHPTAMESYESETYFEQPYARLKINRVVVDNYTTLLPEGVEADDYLKKLPDPMSPAFLNQKGSHEIRVKYESIGRAWASPALHPIFEEEWRTSPSWVRVLGHLKPEDGIFTMENLYGLGVNEIDWGKQSNPTHKAMTSDIAVNSLKSKITGGLIRFSDEKKYAHLTGKYRDRFLALRRVDEVIPLRCEIPRCKVETNRIGVRFFFRSIRNKDPEKPWPISIVEYDDSEVAVERRTAFYDSKTRIIWVFNYGGIL